VDERTSPASRCLNRRLRSWGRHPRRGPRDQAVLKRGLDAELSDRVGYRQGGDDLLIGGPGIDAASSADATTGVTANLGTTTATGQGTDALEDIENLVGSPSPTSSTATAARTPSTVAAGTTASGDRRVTTPSLGGDGNDTIGGGLGNDRLNGGTGTDFVHYGAAPAVVVNLNTGSATGEGTETRVAGRPAGQSRPARRGRCPGGSP
jgi:Ca2+-binding RTX toxin-like protein